MATTFGLAIALMLVFEGLLPCVAPARWRRMLHKVLELSDGQIRFFGVLALSIGLGLMLVLA